MARRMNIAQANLEMKARENRSNAISNVLNTVPRGIESIKQTIDKNKLRDAGRFILENDITDPQGLHRVSTQFGLTPEQMQPVIATVRDFSAMADAELGRTLKRGQVDANDLALRSAERDYGWKDEDRPFKTKLLGLQVDRGEQQKTLGDISVKVAQAGEGNIEEAADIAIELQRINLDLQRERKKQIPNQEKLRKLELERMEFQAKLNKAQEPYIDQNAKLTAEAKDLNVQQQRANVADIPKKRELLEGQVTGQKNRNILGDFSVKKARAEEPYIEEAAKIGIETDRINLALKQEQEKDIPNENKMQELREAYQANLNKIQAITLQAKEAGQPNIQELVDLELKTKQRLEELSELRLTEAQGEAKRGESSRWATNTYNNKLAIAKTAEDRDAVYNDIMTDTMLTQAAQKNLLDSPMLKKISQTFYDKDGNAVVDTPYVDLADENIQKRQASGYRMEKPKEVNILKGVNAEKGVSADVLENVFLTYGMKPTEIEVYNEATGAYDKRKVMYDTKTGEPISGERENQIRMVAKEINKRVMEILRESRGKIDPDVAYKQAMDEYNAAAADFRFNKEDAQALARQQTQQYNTVGTGNLPGAPSIPGGPPSPVVTNVPKVNPELVKQDFRSRWKNLGNF